MNYLLSVHRTAECPKLAIGFLNDQCVTMSVKPFKWLNCLMKTV